MKTRKIIKINMSFGKYELASKEDYLNNKWLSINYRNINLKILVIYMEKKYIIWYNAKNDKR